MERREQVFVSSTYTDLTDERQAVIQTLLEADCIPAGMELFPASNDERWELIKRVIEACDYYIVIVGGRYGTTDDEGVSFTEREFDYAQEIGIPIMGFLHGSPGKIPAEKSELSEAAQKRLGAFREEVGQRMCKHWTTADELGAQVAKSLIQTRKTHPAEGWVRARDAVTPEARAETAELRERIAQLERELAESRSSIVADLQGLAQGDDAHVLRVELRFSYDVRDSDFLSGYTRTEYLSIGGTLSTTWNELLRVLGPLFLHEGSESAFRQQIDVFVNERVDDATLASVPPNDAKFVDCRVHDEDKAVVLIQLYALALIEKGKRRRAVDDRNTYWRLTQDGEAQVMRLQAVRRASSADPGLGVEPITGTDRWSRDIPS